MSEAQLRFKKKNRGKQHPRLPVSNARTCCYTPPCTRLMRGAGGEGGIGAGRRARQPSMRFPTNAEKQQNKIAAHECPVIEKGEFRNSPKDKGGHLSPRLFGRKSDLHSLLMVNQEHAARGLLGVSDGADGFTGRVLFQLNEVSTLPASRR